jgi:hypothetical protein
MEVCNVIEVQRRNNYDPAHTTGLEVCAKEVVVRNSDNYHVVDRILSFDNEVLCALRCRMLAMRKAPTDTAAVHAAMHTQGYIVVLLDSNVMHFFPEYMGMTHIVPVAFPVAKVIAMHVGILVQPDESSKLLSDHLNRFYALWYPLDALQAVKMPQHSGHDLELLATVPITSAWDDDRIDTCLLTRNSLTQTLEIYNTCVEQAPSEPCSYSEDRTSACSWRRSGIAPSWMAVVRPACSRTPESVCHVRELRVQFSTSLEMQVCFPLKRIVYDRQTQCTKVGLLTESSHFRIFTIHAAALDGVLVVRQSFALDDVLDVIQYRGFVFMWM